MVGTLNDISGAIVSAAYQIGIKLGPGLLESVYETILARDLARRGLHVERQRPVSFDYDGLWFENAFRVDLLVEHSVVVEIKSRAVWQAAWEKQLLGYLRLADFRLGLLLNFGAPMMKDGIKRIVNRL